MEGTKPCHLLVLVLSTYMEKSDIIHINELNSRKQYCLLTFRVCTGA